MSKKRKSYVVHLYMYASAHAETTACEKAITNFKAGEDVTCDAEKVTCFLCKPKPKAKPPYAF